MKLPICPKCGKSLANRHNLSRHKKNGQAVYEPVTTLIRDRSPILPRKLNISNFSDEAEKSGTLKNPKLQTLIDEIINDSFDSRPIPTLDKRSAAEKHSSETSTKLAPLILPKKMEIKAMCRTNLQLANATQNSQR